MYGEQPNRRITIAEWPAKLLLQPEKKVSGRRQNEGGAVVRSVGGGKWL